MKTHKFYQVYTSDGSVYTFICAVELTDLAYYSRDLRKGDDDDAGEKQTIYYDVNGQMNRGEWNPIENPNENGAIKMLLLAAFDHN